MTDAKRRKTALIIGGGPAGLTAAYELATRTDIHPVVVEADDILGGIARTVNHNGNRIDIGGHRFFSKSDRVMDWWAEVLPLERLDGDEGGGLELHYQNKSTTYAPKAGQGVDPETTDEVMLVRNRVSRIYFGRQMFDYPLSLNFKTLRTLGLGRTIAIVASYAKARIAPVRPENSLRDFLINRFGYRLYATFFRDYTEKVWGVACEDIPADWGRQRIKGLSVTELLKNMWRRFRGKGAQGLDQKDVETSLIERFLYPKLGPGQLWEVVARRMQEAGGELHMQTRVTEVFHDGAQVTGATVRRADGTEDHVTADYIFSTMPVLDLLQGWQPPAPKEVRAVSDGLTYRDFITVGILLDRLTLAGGTRAHELAEKVPDNWIYIQEPDVKLGRLQIFNNWSPYLVADPDTVWLGLEYFVNEGDELWTLPDAEMTALGVAELEKLGIADGADVRDSVVVRIPKTYPAYFGSYDRFDEVEAYVRQFDNLYCIGRNGMHRYNNQDHSILTAMLAVDGLVEGRDMQDALWQVNTEDEYHESK